MRPICPSPSEYPKIRKAFRAAKFMKWCAGLLLCIALIFSVLVGRYTAWYLGLALLLVLWTAILIGGFSQARCPRCGQIWWSIMVLLPIAPLWLVLVPDYTEETDSFVCRRCRLDIGIGLK